jgi:hypothetical protein
MEVNYKGGEGLKLRRKGSQVNCRDYGLVEK